MQHPAQVSAVHHPLAFDKRDVAWDVRDTTLASLGLKVKQAFGHRFDFGDDWWRQVTVRTIHDKASRGRYPKVKKRVGESPPQYPDSD